MFTPRKHLLFLIFLAVASLFRYSVLGSAVKQERINSKAINITPVLLSSRQNVYRTVITFEGDELLSVEFLHRTHGRTEFNFHAERQLNTEKWSKYFGTTPVVSYKFFHNIPPNQIRMPKVVFEFAAATEIMNVYRIDRNKIVKVNHRRTVQPDGSIRYYLSPKALDALFFLEGNNDVQ